MLCLIPEAHEPEPTKPVEKNIDTTAATVPVVSESVQTVTTQPEPETKAPDSPQLTEQAFFDWIERLKTDFDLRQLEELDRVSMGLKIKNVFGAMTGSTVFALAGFAEAQAVQSKSLKVDKQTGNLSRTGTISVPTSHHYGKI